MAYFLAVTFVNIYINIIILLYVQTILRWYTQFTIILFKNEKPLLEPNAV